MITNREGHSSHEPMSKLAFVEEREWMRVTLSSIGDAVVTADANGNVTFLNAAAQSLTGWTLAESAGVPLEAVFHIINEESRMPAENPAARALREGAIVGLANHSLLIARDGTERPIEDRPLRSATRQATSPGSS